MGTTPSGEAVDIDLAPSVCGDHASEISTRQRWCFRHTHKGGIMEIWGREMVGKEEEEGRRGGGEGEEKRGGRQGGEEERRGGGEGSRKEGKKEKGRKRRGRRGEERKARRE